MRGRSGSSSRWPGTIISRSRTLLGHVGERTKAPILPPLLIGVLAAALLVLNINLPHVIETLCAVAIVWVNLAYLLVTFPMLMARLRRRGAYSPSRLNADGRNGAETTGRGYFSMGRFGLAVNAIAVVWGVFMVVNISWPRTAVYGPDRWGRFAAPLATLALLASVRSIIGSSSDGRGESSLSTLRHRGH